MPPKPIKAGAAKAASKRKEPAGVRVQQLLPRRRMTRAARPGVSLDEDAMDDVGEVGKTQQEKDREEWEKYDTPLISAWICDYPGGKKLINGLGVKMHDREAIIDCAVQSAKLPVPESKALALLQKNWKKLAPRGADLSQPPGRWAEAVSSSSDEEEEQEEQEEEEETDADAYQATLALRTPDKKTTASGGSAGKSSGASAKTAKTLFPSNTGAGTMPKSCVTCATPRPEGVSGEDGWVCAGPGFLPGTVCGLRGDLPPAHPTNVYRETRRREAAGIVPNPNAAGQTTEARTAATPKQTKIEAELERQRLAGPAHPLFARPKEVTEAQEEAAVKAALDIMRVSYGARGYEYPSAPLRALIQSGRLLNIGFAMPIREGLPVSVDPSVLIDGKTVNLSSSSLPVAPLVPNLAAFLDGVFAIILPTLTARPAAQLQWMALARSAIQLEMKFGWKETQRYISVVLADRLRKEEGLAKADLEFVQENFTSLARGGFAATTAPAARTQQGGSAAGGSVPQAAGKWSGTCDQWNDNAKVCERPDGAQCRFLHACDVCRATTHTAKECSVGGVAQQEYAARRARRTEKKPGRTGSGAKTGSAPVAKSG
jgi:hypothetical protein